MKSTLNHLDASKVNAMKDQPITTSPACAHIEPVRSTLEEPDKATARPLDLIEVERKVFVDLIAAAQMAKAWLAERTPGDDGDRFLWNPKLALFEAIQPAVENRQPEVAKAVNEYEALCAVEKTAAKLLESYNLIMHPDGSDATNPVAKRARAALSALATLRQSSQPPKEV